MILYFNSHAHVERDRTCKTNGQGTAISTHTLTWSVTLPYYPPQDREGISTHTLTWSVTLLKWYFLIFSDISTHTLTWSVTVRHFTADFLHCNFNSHAHVERDKFITCSSMVSGISTHTLTWSVTQFPAP